MEALSPDVRELIRAIARRHGAMRVRLFGSRARGGASAASDIDLLVEFDASRSLLDLVAMEREIRHALNISVDILTPASLSPYIREQVEREAIPL
jgi:predicted nucleotidyltransferase